VIRLAQIWIYPVKGLRGTARAEAEVVRRGIAHDRRWMLVDDEGRFLSQREVPTLALFSTAIDGVRLLVTAPGGAQLTLPLDLASGPRVDVHVWRDRTPALIHVEASRFFTEVLCRSVRAVFMPDDVERPVNPAHAQAGDQVAFADGYPMLMVSEASLAALNLRLAEPVTMARFRPNLVVSGCGAHDEDAWPRFRISEIDFRPVKRCGRCVVVTIDPETAQAGKEPLATLAGYRQFGHEVCFGMNVVHEGLGPLHVGDELVPAE
jgi:uncharacterized protein YcbX